MDKVFKRRTQKDRESGERTVKDRVLGRTKLPQNSSNYYEYVKSQEWRQKSCQFLKLSGNRCAMFPWVRVGRVDGRYHRYACHHTHYGTLGNERQIDCLVLCPFAHEVIIHGLLSGWRRTSKQKNYPNLPQRMAHFWCRLPVFFKIAILVQLIVVFFLLDKAN